MPFATALPPERADFLRRLENGTCSHAFIVEGAKGAGKKDFALWCASVLLCESPHGKPCTVCKACRKVAHGHHPDVHFYGDGDKAVTVGDVRSLIRETGLVPADGERSVYILCNAQKMQAAAQNAMLKVFEEPPPGVVIFLLTDSRRALLPTVRSRGQMITLSALSDETLSDRLRAKYPRIAERDLQAAVKAAEGSIGEADDFLKKDAVQTREKATEWLDAAFSGDKYRLIASVSPAAGKRETALAAVDAFLRLLFDLLLVKHGCDSVVLSADIAKDYSEKATGRSLAAMCELTVDCREALESNGNVTAVMTRLATGLWSAAN